MPVRLSTTVSKIASLPNATNAALISEFYQYMKNNGASDVILHQSKHMIVIIVMHILWNLRSSIIETAANSM